MQADSQPKSSGLVLSRRPLGAVLHSTDEPGELSQWLCHDDSTINVVFDIIIIILLLLLLHRHSGVLARSANSIDTGQMDGWADGLGYWTFSDRASNYLSCWSGILPCNSNPVRLQRLD